MKVHGQKRTLVVTRTTSNGKFISRKVIGNKRNVNSRIVCAVDPVTATAAVIAAAGTTVQAYIQVREHYRSRRTQKKCSFFYASKKRKCNRPIIHSRYGDKNDKKYRFNICDHNHETFELIHVLPPKT
jgi:hypothetical protein